MANSDITNLIKAGALEVKNAEHSDERNSRLRIKEADANHCRFRENFKLVTSCLIIAGFVLGSVYCALTSVDPAIKQWCLATLTMVVSGGVGYIAGENKNKKPD